MKKYVMIMDVSKCNMCYNCCLSCKDEHFGREKLPIFKGQQELRQNWVNLYTEERGSGSKIRITSYADHCRHCDEPKCVAASKNGAVYKREDGIVIIDPVKAEGQKELLDACPHKAISWNKESNLPQKCTFCAHLLDAGEKEPRCVEACPTGALIFGDANDPESEVSRLIREYPEAAKGTALYRFINMPAKFISGSVYLGDKEEVAENAEITLLADGEVIQATKADGFGDFTFDDIEPDQDFVLKVSYEGYPEQTFNVNTEEDACFEEIVL